MQPMNTIGSVRQLIGAEYLESTFFTDKCFTVVDRFFFPEYPEFILAHQFFVIRTEVIETRNFVAKVRRILQSAFAAEVCGGLCILLSVLKV